MRYIKNHYYHVYNRGNNRQQIFIDKENYHYLLNLLQRYQDQFDVRIIAYCLMPNHYHFLLMQSGDSSISQFLKSTFQSYVQAFNKKYEQTGRLFEGQPKANLIDNDAYLLHICRYIHLNPVESKIVSDIEDWPYSNYLEFIGKRNGKLFESTFLRNFYQSSENYQEFVLEYLNEKLRYSEIKKYL